MTILADGRIATTDTIILQVSGADVLPTTKVTCERITFFNESAVEQTAILSIKKFSETSRKLRQFKLLQNEGGEYLEPGETLPLDNGDALIAQTTNADAVNFIVFGTRS